MFPLDGNKAVFHFCSNTKPDVNSALICSLPRKAEGTLSLSQRHSICVCEYNTRRICLHRKIGIVLICSRLLRVLWGDFPRTAVEKSWANTSTMLTCAGLTQKRSWAKDCDLKKYNRLWFYSNILTNDVIPHLSLQILTSLPLSLASGVCGYELTGTLSRPDVQQSFGTDASLTFEHRLPLLPSLFTMLPVFCSGLLPWRLLCPVQDLSKRSHICN